MRREGMRQRKKGGKGRGGRGTRERWRRAAHWDGGRNCSFPFAIFYRTTEYEETSWQFRLLFPLACLVLGYWSGCLVSAVYLPFHVNMGS